MNATVTNLPQQRRKSQNDHIRACVAGADKCLAHLINRGLVVYSIHIEVRMPVVTIENPRGKLGGGMYRRAHDRGAVVESYVTEIMGCQVRWNAYGGAA